MNKLLLLAFSELARKELEIRLQRLMKERNEWYDFCI